MNFLNITIYLFFLSLSLLAEVNTKNLIISGNFLGIYNSLEERQTQFDYATNLDFAYTISDDLSGSMQFQSSPGNGSLGFTGPAVTLTDIAIVYTPPINNRSMSVTFGSFDTPFGYETNFLTNNADTFSNRFVINSLTYSAIGGHVGTLNTLGLKVENKFKYIDVISMISNGTSETAYNEKATFERLTQLSFHSLIRGLRLTGSYFESNDEADTQDSFESDLTAFLIEIDYNILNLEFKLKKAEFDFDDGNALTSNDIDSYEAEINYTNNTYFLGLRGSFWRPQGSPISSDSPSPGLASSRSTSEAIDRVQIAAGYYLNKNTLYKIEYFTEHYGGGSGFTEEDYSGIITGLNVQF